MTIDITLRAIVCLIFGLLGGGVVLFTVVVFLTNLIKGANHERRHTTRNISDARLRQQIHEKHTINWLSH